MVTPAEAAVLGGSLLAEGRPFHAHEVFEAAWKSAPDADRELWRGLAQIAVGLTHARRGQRQRRGDPAPPRRRRGARRTRATRPAVDRWFRGRERGRTSRNRIERDGLAAVPAADLLFPLRPGVSGG